MNLQPVDIVFSLLLLFVSVRGAMRGFVAEFFSFAAVIAGIGSAVLFSGIAAQRLEPYLGPSFWNGIIAFLVIFLVVYLVVKVIENSLHRLLENVNLEKLDRALGLFLGFTEGVVLTGAVLLLLRVQPLFDASSLLNDSFFARMLLPLIPATIENVTGGIEARHV